MGSETRQRNTHVMIRVSQEEKKYIQDMADQCDLKVSALLRNLGLSYEPQSNIDAKAVEKLEQLHGDIRRVGELLKLWLSQESFKHDGDSLNAPTLVNQIIKLQKEISSVLKRL
jgi:hypothetical protein